MDPMLQGLPEGCKQGAGQGWSPSEGSAKEEPTSNSCACLLAVSSPFWAIDLKA